MFYPFVSSPRSVARRRIVLASTIALVGGAALPAGAQRKPGADGHGAAPGAATSVDGVPNLPDVVTVVPFYWKPDETSDEMTKVVIQAEVDGRRGVFIVDLGCPPLLMNRTFLQPSPSGGVDTVTDANRIPDHAEEGQLSTFDKVHVTMRIGTLLVKFDDPMLNKPYNAYLGHQWGNFGWNFAPRLGNIGLSVLEPFETIVDYTHQRLVLIRLDSAGRRLANVPAYTPRRSFPLIDVFLDASKKGMQWWGLKTRRDYTVDTLDANANTMTRIIDTGAQDNSDGPNGMQLLGYPFLKEFGVVGFNHKTHQFILYR